MTGNKNAWRAPLAGLASLAMIATMGVAASTANAAAWSDPTQYTVKFVAENGQTHEVKAYSGETLADANGGYDTINYLGDTAPAAQPAGKVFGGWSADGKTPIDFSETVTANQTVKPIWLDASYANGKSSVVKVTIDSSVSALTQLPAGSTFYVAKGEAIPSQLLPVDVADGKLIKDYTVAGNQSITNPVTDLTGIVAGNPVIGSDGVTVSVNSEEAHVSTLVLDYSGLSAKGYPVGAESDGNASIPNTPNSDLYAKDVVSGTKATVPEWFTIPQSGTDKNTTVETWINGNDTYAAKAGITLNQSVFLLSPSKTSEKYWVRFEDADGTYLGGDEVSEGEYASTVVPNAPSKDGYAFAGWVIKGWSNGPVFVDESQKVDDPVAGSLRHLSAYAVKSNVTFQATYNNRTTKIQVKFVDAKYNGAHKSETVTVAVPGTLTEDQTPDWTREGYIGPKWYTDAALKNEYKFSQWLTDKDTNFTLYAGWTQATSDTAKAAIEYVFPAAYNELYADGANNAKAANPVKDENTPFTASSWKAYKAAFKPILEQYLTKVYNQPNTGVTAKDSAEIINELNDAWAKLRFATTVDETNLQPSNAAAKVVYRLNREAGLHHLLTSDKNEVWTLTNNTVGLGGWTKDDTTFRIINDKNVNLAANRASWLSGVKVDDVQIVPALITKVTRLYNAQLQEHMYTSDSNEIDTLTAGDWSIDSDAAAFYVPALYATKTKVVRLYNPGTHLHLYTSDTNEVNVLTTKGGWTKDSDKAGFYAL